MELNGKIEFERNQERYSFLRWGQKSLENFKVVPPKPASSTRSTMENLAREVMGREVSVDGVSELQAFPDTVFGTDSHTTMINGIGVLGWGVGGIEAEAAMLGQPSSMLIPQVVGFRLTGKLPEGATATDLVLTVTQMLRSLGVVGKFVEFFGEGLQHPAARRPRHDRQHGAGIRRTCGIFPIDAEAVRYLRLSGRCEEQIALVEAYAKAQGLWHDAESRKRVTPPRWSWTWPRSSVAGRPEAPADRVLLSGMKENFHAQLQGMTANRPPRKTEVKRMDAEGGAQPQAEPPRGQAEVQDPHPRPGLRPQRRSVVIAAITSCTNTSIPAVMLGAGLLARNAARIGLKAKPWVKTSLGPRPRCVVTDYLKKAGVMADLEKLGFFVVGYGCTTCIGNSGPLPDEVSRGIAENDLVVASVLSGNRNFEGACTPKSR